MIMAPTRTQYAYDSYSCTHSMNTEHPYSVPPLLPNNEPYSCSLSLWWHSAVQTMTFSVNCAINPFPESTRDTTSYEIDIGSPGSSHSVLFSFAASLSFVDGMEAKITTKCAKNSHCFCAMWVFQVFWTFVLCRCFAICCCESRVRSFCLRTLCHVHTVRVSVYEHSEWQNECNSIQLFTDSLCIEYIYSNMRCLC